MNQRKLCAALLSLALISLFVSCRKEKERDMYDYLFSGRWQTSYGDTIVFSNEGGKHILNYVPVLNPSEPAHVKIEYIYNNDNLGLKDEYATPGNFRMLQSFTWSQDASVFIVQAKEWYPTVTDPLTYYMFTRLR